MDFHTYNEVFDDEFFDLVNENEFIALDSGYKFGDVLVYDSTKNDIHIIPGKRCDKEKDKHTLGIVIKKEENIDIILKNFISAESIRIPFSYYNKSMNNIYAYIKDLFDRYCNKYKHSTSLNLDFILLHIPNVLVMDFIWTHLHTYKDIMYRLYGEEKSDQFFKRIYLYGVIAQYNGKYYQWLPIKDDKRQINNLTCVGRYELLPMFSVLIKSKDKESL